MFPIAGISGSLGLKEQAQILIEVIAQLCHVDQSQPQAQAS
jgi:hypothetical protein